MKCCLAESMQPVDGHFENLISFLTLKLIAINLNEKWFSNYCYNIRELVSIAMSDKPMLYGTLMLWMASRICSWIVACRRKRGSINTFTKFVFRVYYRSWFVLQVGASPGTDAVWITMNCSESNFISVGLSRFLRELSVVCLTFSFRYMLSESEWQMPVRTLTP
jgi:hypothetical protein